MIRPVLAAAGLALAVSASGEDSHLADELAKYRQMLEEGNPAELMEMRGEELWTMPRGPNNTALAACDLGLGPGKVEGAYAQLPRYFADSGRVEDAESRLVTCMATLQGMAPEEAIRDWTRPGSDLEALVTYVATQSRGHPIALPEARPEEQRMIRLGEAFFYRRSGPLDFACATCHSNDGRRIRLQELPNFRNADNARASMITWPAYRVSQSAVWTMERRLIDCIRQMRNPEPGFGSDAIIALQSYLQHQAAGGVMKGPGIKR
ncbi:MAG: sulfur oxidation c-type cytochrome SoxA [Burkholderiales bacterium]